MNLETTHCPQQSLKFETIRCQRRLAGKQDATFNTRASAIPLVPRVHDAPVTQYCRVPYLSVALDVSLVAHVQAQLVAQLVPPPVVRIVAIAHRIKIEPGHDNNKNTREKSRMRRGGVAVFALRASHEKTGTSYSTNNDIYIYIYKSTTTTMRRPPRRATLKKRRRSTRDATQPLVHRSTN